MKRAALIIWGFVLMAYFGRKLVLHSHAVYVTRAQGEILSIGSMIAFGICLIVGMFLAFWGILGNDLKKT